MSKQSKVCEYCGRGFIDWSGRSKYCSRACLGFGFRLKNPNYEKEYRRRKRPIHNKICRNCDKAFETTNSIKVFCCDECKIAHHNKKRPTTKYQIRICTICGKTFKPMQKTGVGRAYCAADCRRDRELRRAHGISLEEYNRLLKKQNGVCVICGKSETQINSNSKRIIELAVDHCHKTGRIRGLLCSRCNNGLGCFKDSPELFEKAITYLESK